MNNKKQKRTSLKDLAKELNVSIATVSRALRSSSEIGEEMQRRVKDLAKKMNYRPNPFAQSLRKEAPKIIGVVVPNLETHYYAAVLDGIEDEARRAGYRVSLPVWHKKRQTIVILMNSTRWESPWFSSVAPACLIVFQV